MSELGDGRPVEAPFDTAQKGGIPGDVKGTFADVRAIRLVLPLLATCVD